MFLAFFIIIFIFLKVAGRSAKGQRETQEKIIPWLTFAPSTGIGWPTFTQEIRTLIQTNRSHFVHLKYLVNSLWLF